MTEWQKVEYDIMCKVVDICEEHKIQYFLSSGTLLGAVRHKGFIPWDDDVDIGMPMKEYKKFCKISQKEFEGKGLFLQTHHTEKHYNSMWARIRANGTTSMPKELVNWDIHWGATIDVFPMIGLYNNRIMRFIQYKLFYYNTILLNVARQKDMKEVPHNRLERFFSFIPLWLRLLLVDINNLFIDGSFSDKREISEKWWCLKYQMRAEYYEKAVKLQFEDRYFDAPYRYDEELTLMYGDYMTPPPENERGGHELTQGDTVFDCHTDYKVHK